MNERILVMDGVHESIIGLLKDGGYTVTHVDKKTQLSPEQLSEMLPGLDALVVRSYDLKPSEKNAILIPENLLAIGRAGAGVDKIPHGDLRNQGIAVFNTPGSNANSVKELVIANLIAASRNLYDATNWTNTLTTDVLKTAEKEKKKFKGSEIDGKKIGVIGLGYIGQLVANDATNLGMQVVGYDPFISKEQREKLSRNITIVDNLADLLTKTEYVTIHSAYTGKNKNMISAEQMDAMKKGTILLNFARGELVDNSALKQNIESGKISKYVTDFPTDDLVGLQNIVRIPHLGASTDEAEERCAIMLAKQFDDYFKKGEIKNAVNLPKVQLDSSAKYRLGLIMKDRPGIISEITGAFSKRAINIEDLTYHSTDGFGYFLGSSKEPIAHDMLDEVKKIDGYVRSRVIE